MYGKLDMTVNPHDPRPWGTPVVTLDLEFPASGETNRPEQVRLPDRGMAGPRLRFQRQLDLAFHLASDPRWAASYARHLCKTRRCSRVVVSVQTHQIPDLVAVRAAAAGLGPPIDLESDDTYTPRRKLGEFRCTDF